MPWKHVEEMMMSEEEVPQQLEGLVSVEV